MNGLKTAIRDIRSLEDLANRSDKTEIHLLHPLTKVFATLAYIVAVLLLDRFNMAGLVIYAAYPFFLIFVSDTPMKSMWRKIAVALPFSLFAGLSNVVLDREVALAIGCLPVTYGTISCLTIIIKTIICIMAVFLLMATTSMNELAHSLRRLHIPAVMVMQLVMTYRYLSLLVTEANGMYTAYRLRAGGGKGIRMHNMGEIVGQLLLRSISRAGHVYNAMLCRGYTGDFYTRKREFAGRDLVFAVASFAFFLAAGWYARRFG